MFELRNRSDNELLNELFAMWLSNELSSSPEDVPMVNIAPFFFGCNCWYVGEVFKMGVGWAPER